MFVQVHTYYSNLFEPGVLFPETVSLSFSDQLEGVDSAGIKTTRLEYDGGSIDADTSGYQFTEPVAFSASMEFGYLGLIYLGAPEDFNLAELMEANTAVQVMDISNSEYPLSAKFEAIDIDFELTLTSEGSVNISTSSVDTNFILAPSSGLAITIN